MSFKALDVIKNSEYVVGYTAYVDLIKHLLTDKKVENTGMMQEVDRCRKAVDIAATGKVVSVISSGDPGVYAMAGLVLELVMKLPENERPEVEIIPGISAVNMSAALLGAPLMHDFVVLSLSDLLTPWEKIELRINMAAKGDFVTAIYNPRSKKRVEHIVKVQEIMLKHRDPKTPVGIVTNANRDGQKVVISTLDSFTDEFIDMFSLVIIGNSNTYVEAGRIITPRGYHI